MNFTSYLDKGMSYSEFIELANQLVNSNNYSKDYADYTQLNLLRMKRWDKKGEINNDFAVNSSQKWLVITEPWCGDSAHSLPFINKIAEVANVPLKIVLRDENEELMNRFLTNKSKSIPILIALDQEKNVLYKWGPRPKELQEWMMEAKRKNTSQNEIFDYLQKFYNKDTGKSVAREIFELMK